MKKSNKVFTVLFAMCFTCIIGENLAVSYFDANPSKALLRISIMFLCMLVNYYHESNMRAIYESRYDELCKLTEELIAKVKDSNNDNLASD